MWLVWSTEGALEWGWKVRRWFQQNWGRSCEVLTSSRSAWRVAQQGVVWIIIHYIVAISSNCFHSSSCFFFQIVLVLLSDGFKYYDTHDPQPLLPWWTNQSYRGTKQSWSSSLKTDPESSRTERCWVRHQVPTRDQESSDCDSDSKLTRVTTKHSTWTINNDLELDWDLI